MRQDIVHVYNLKNVKELSLPKASWNVVVLALIT